jgi:uncharacterized protein YjdB
MISILAARPARGLLFACKSVTAVILLGLVALSGCHDDSSQAPAHPAAPTLQSLEVSPTNPTVAASTSVQLAVTAIYSDGSHTDVTAQAAWSSSSTAVATIGAATGKAVGVDAGSATLTANFQGQSASTTLVVTAATLVSIKVIPASASIAAGTTQAFMATGTFSNNTSQNLTADVTWSSSNAAAATINGSGLATALSPGNATITATCNTSGCGSVTGSATLTVTAATLVSIAVTAPSPSVALGSAQQLTATGTYTDHSTQNLSSQATWVSSNPAVATINASGVATPVTIGSTGVTAAFGGVTSPPLTLTVTTATLVSIAVTPTAPSITHGATQQFTATGTYSDSSTQDITTSVTWNSSVPAAATISNASGMQGLATGVSVGTTNISATLGGITSAVVALAVEPPSFTVPGPYTWTVPAGVTTVQVVATGGGGGGGAVSTTGGNGGVVTATLSVSPGDTLQLYVGGGGAAGSMFVGGGGGGSSNINAGMPNQVIAGGGGGGGHSNGGDGNGGNGAVLGGGIAGGLGGRTGIGGSGTVGPETGNTGGNGNGGPGGAGAGSSPNPAGGLGFGTGSGAAGTAEGGGGGGGYGGGGGNPYGGGGGGSTGPSGSMLSLATNGGTSQTSAGGNGSITITIVD